MTETAEILDRLAKTLAQKSQLRPEHSYTAQLVQGGREKILRKLSEELLEVVLAASKEKVSTAEMTAESADLLYHLLVLWQQAGIAPEEVWKELARRQGVSGLEEKAARKKP